MPATEIKDVVRIGIIGCGVVAESYHWRNWDNLRYAKVTAVADIKKDAVEAAARRFRAQAYSSHRALIEEADVDALFIFLPPFAHGEPEMLAVQRGLPFFVEKPVALDVDVACKVASAVEEKSIITSVGYQWRYDSAVQMARTLLGNRKIVMVNGYWLGSAVHRATPAWWRDRSLSGGQLIEQSTHIIDLLRYFGGEVTSVYCHQVHRLTEAADIPDAGAMVLEYSSGAMGTVVNGCSLPKNGLRAGASVVAHDLFLEVTQGKTTIHCDGKKDEYTSPRDLDHEPYFVEDQVFIDAVRLGDRSKIRSDYSDGVRTLAVSLAADESSRSGQPIRVSW